MGAEGKKRERAAGLLYSCLVHLCLRPLPSSPDLAQTPAVAISDCGSSKAIGSSMRRPVPSRTAHFGAHRPTTPSGPGVVAAR
ncbi:hypothetical protein GGF39_002142 [Coemansia sp. RSA 1721]|nr:hypothetical protein GGF39_002142 [Coemansia sp. RSA 1721]